MPWCYLSSPKFHGAVEIVAGLEPGETIVISNLDPFRSADTVLLTN